MRSAAAMALGIAILGLVGCATDGYKKGDATASSSEELSQRVQLQTAYLETTVASLSNLVHQPQPDLKPQFERFDRSLDRLIAAARRTESTGRQMQARGVAYFQAWEEELGTMTYGVVRESSEARKAEVQAQFERISERFEQNQAVVRPLIVYLEDIRKALRSDLTEGGLQAVRDIAGRADENARKVQLALQQLRDELAVSSLKMTSGLKRNVRTMSDAVGGEDQHAEAERP